MLLQGQAQSAHHGQYGGVDSQIFRQLSYGKGTRKRLPIAILRLCRKGFNHRHCDADQGRIYLGVVKLQKDSKVSHFRRCDQFS